MREAGYYWVRWQDEWLVGEWTNYTKGYWVSVIGWIDQPYNDRVFDEIGPRLTPPPSPKSASEYEREPEDIL
jgi:hypothetical protein